MSEQNCALLQLAVPLTGFAKKMPDWWGEDHWLPSQHPAAPKKSWAWSESPSNTQTWFWGAQHRALLCPAEHIPLALSMPHLKGPARRGNAVPCRRQRGHGEMEDACSAQVADMRTDRQRTLGMARRQVCGVLKQAEAVRGEEEWGGLASLGESRHWSTALLWHLDMATAPPASLRHPVAVWWWKSPTPSPLWGLGTEVVVCLVGSNVADATALRSPQCLWWWGRGAKLK